MTDKGPITIATTYLPPRRAHVPIGEILQILNKQHQSFLIADLNARHPLWGHATTNALGNNIATQITRQNIQYLGPEFKTHLGMGRWSTPDIILTNRHNTFNYHIERGPLTTSDHLPVIVTIATKPIIIHHSPTYNDKRTDWEEYKRQIDTEIQTHLLTDSWEDGKTAQHIDTAITNWHNIIIKARENTTPKRHYKTTNKTTQTDLLKLLHIKYKTLMTRLDRYGYDRTSLTTLRQIQQTLRDETTKISNYTWGEIIKNLASKRHDAQTFWREVKRLKGTTNTKTNYIYDDQQNKIFDDTDKVNIFTNIWENIFQITPQENQKFDRENEHRVTQYIETNRHRTTPYEHSDLTRLDSSTDFTTPMTNTDFDNIIKHFKHKAPGASNIGKRLLQHLPQTAKTVYTNNINKALSMGHYPTYFKQGLITLVEKPGKDPRDPRNSRPITLLEVTGKILERHLNNKLKHHLEHNNILQQHQYGFRAGRGTEQALTTVYETIAKNQQEGGRAALVCRDVSKAFDKVWHDGLKYKILGLDLPDTLEKTLCGFLDNRKARIKLNANTKGREMALLSGVPQGSIHSPTLHILYTARHNPQTNKQINHTYK